MSDQIHLREVLANAFFSSELLLLFAVVLVGLALGRVSVRGFRLGVAGVLFAGLGLGAWLTEPQSPLRLATPLRDVGLVLFVYLVGLSSGPGFFRAWRQGGQRASALVLAALLTGATIAYLGGRWLGLDAGYVAGMFTGALTNTPALAAATERLQGTSLGTHPAIAYSLTYPLGVLGGLALLRLSARAKAVALKREIDERSSGAERQLLSANFRITRAAIAGRSIGDLRVRHDVGVVVSRWHHDGQTKVPTKFTVLNEGDIVTVVGSASALAAAEAYFGARSDEQLQMNREDVDMRRILVSRRDLVGCALRDLDLERRFNAQVTRLRRADLDMLPSPEVRLEIGDRLRVVAPCSRLKDVSAFFGDSEKSLAEVDFVSLALGILAGLVLARVPLPLPTGNVTLGIAGGPLIVALILGRAGRTGPFVWSMPYEATVALRELGLLLFLAGVGVGAGAALGNLPGTVGLSIVGLGAVITLVCSGLVLTVAPLFARTSITRSLGTCSGMQTQPATLAAAYEMSGRSEETYVAYAVVYPVAMIGKILIAQLLLMLSV
ncbi:MAG: TrkA C-terminal domain-containing protein [Deltaproteobacteria bacterium]|nr:TrkA C-terminal domain-containing protein [Deltaproteobacteria bacterium]